MRALKNLVWVAVGFLLAVLLRKAVIPEPRWPIELESDEAIPTAERAACNVLFIGPSYVAQLQPEPFNDEASRIGFYARMCRYGTSALMGYELVHHLERLLDEDFPALELVVIDTTLGDGVAFDPDNRFKPRMLEWHTWGSARWLYEFYGERDRRSAIEKLPDELSHAGHVVAHFVELGRGIDLLSRLSVVERIAPRGDVAEEHRPRPPEVSRRKRKAKVTPYEEKLAALAKRKDGAKLRSEPWAVELRELVRKRGLEAYFLYSPVLWARRKPHEAVRGKDPLVLLDFNDPERYPELYREDVRGSTNHLNGVGNVTYSKLLARKLYRVRSRR